MPAKLTAVLIIALAIGVLQVVLAGFRRARANREGLDGLLQAAIVAHASMEPAEVEEAITGSARTLLHCRGARIGEIPPDEGELGSPLAGRRYPERWLVVSERRGAEPFGARDAKLLDAIVAVGSSALENAALVDQIKHQVFHDALTGLPNQLCFEERTSAALAQLRAPGDILAVLCIDLDRFKRVNDGLGHPAGNELLRQVAARLSAAVPAGDTVARMGGDEYTILLTSVRSTSEAVLVAEQILRSFVEPFVLEGQGVHLTPSIGIAIAPGDGFRASALVKNADTATHRAKERGRNCYQLYSTEMNVEASRRLALEGDLHQALATGQLRVVYQPQVDLSTGRTVGVEALARWPHPLLGTIGPDTFIPLAEETGLIAALDDWVLQTACAQGRVWAAAGLPSLRIAVNLSGQAFHRTNVVARVAETLARTALPAAQLELEVTESMAIDQAVDVRPTFRELEALGVKLAIDDFGTGYSALSRLQGFPFHSLKIDRSFVANIESADDGAPIVAAMIAMAHALGLDVVAEGVETSAQQAFLERHRCDMAQGYRFSRPVDPADIGPFLVRHRGLLPVR